MDIELETVYAQRKTRGSESCGYKSNMEESEGRAVDRLQRISFCQACQQDWDVLLILPCSHTMCVLCISAGEAGKLNKSRLGAICAVACPSCRHLVELPCWDWSSATSCLPKQPSVSFKKNTNITKDPHQQVRRAVQIKQNGSHGTSKGLSFDLWVKWIFFFLFRGTYTAWTQGRWRL